MVILKPVPRYRKLGDMVALLPCGHFLVMSTQLTPEFTADLRWYCGVLECGEMGYPLKLWVC